MKKIMKFVLVLISAVMAVSTFALAKAEENEITVFVDGEHVEFDVPPVIEDGRTLVPMRAIVEALDCKVEWIPETKKVVVSWFDDYWDEYDWYDYDEGWDDEDKIFEYYESVELVIGKYVADTYEFRLDVELGKKEVNENSVNSISLDVPAKIMNGRTFVPIRFIGELTGYGVEWNGYYKHIYIGDCEDLKEEIEIKENQNQVCLYEPDPFFGASKRYVRLRDVDSYLADGWYRTEEEAIGAIQIKVFAPDGDGIKSLVIKNAEKDAYLSVGWYETDREARDARITTLYAADGRTIDVKRSEVEAYLAVGWYETLEEAEDSYKTTLYAEDGRTIKVLNTEVQSYLNAGWYDSKEAADNAVRTKKDKEAVYNFKKGDVVVQHILIAIRYGEVQNVNYQTGQVQVRWHLVTDTNGLEVNTTTAMMMYNLYNSEWVRASTLR